MNPGAVRSAGSEIDNAQVICALCGDGCGTRRLESTNCLAYRNAKRECRFGVAKASKEPWLKVGAETMPFLHLVRAIAVTTITEPSALVPGMAGFGLCRHGAHQIHSPQSPNVFATPAQRSLAFSDPIVIDGCRFDSCRGLPDPRTSALIRFLRFRFLVLTGGDVDTRVRQHEPLDRASTDDVGVDNLINIGRGDPAVPHALRIDD